MRVCVVGLRLALAIAAMLPLSNCANDGQSSLSLASTPASSNEAESSTASAPVAQSIPTAGIEANASSDYHIAAHDVLDVQVFQVPDLNRTVEVDGTGAVFLPLIGRVEVAGKSVEQAREEISNKLGKTYLQSPQVSVLVKQSGQRVTVSGAVTRPGVAIAAGKLTLTQAVAGAGGMSDIANGHRVHVARVVPGQKVNDTVYDLDAVQSGKAVDPTLQGGDIVVVETSSTQVVLKTLKDLVPFGVLTAAVL